VATTAFSSWTGRPSRGRRQALAKGAAAVGAVAAVGLASAIPAGADEQQTDLRLVGSWDATVTFAQSPPPPFRRIFTFAPGGGFITVAAPFPTTGVGTWTSESRDQFAFTFLFFRFDTQGNPSGHSVTTAHGLIGEDAIHGAFSSTTFATAVVTRTGTFLASRFEVGAR
jgi:hypothetical protein